METKKQIRQRILLKRSELSEAACTEKSNFIMNKVTAHEHYKNAAELLIYVDYNHEVQTRNLIQNAIQEGKKVFCPKVVGDPANSKMEFYEIHALSDLAEGYRGIMEPQIHMENPWRNLQSDNRNVHDTHNNIENEQFIMHDTMHKRKSVLMIMPGVVFDKNRNRIGYGKGYYDRFLEKYGACLHTIAVCFDCQIVDHIDAGAHDMTPEILFTESMRYYKKA